MAKWHLTLYIENGRIADRPRCAVDDRFAEDRWLITGVISELPQSESVIIAGRAGGGRKGR